MLVQRTDDRAEENKELRIFMRRLAGIEQIAQFRIAYRIIDVLARTVYAMKRLLVQQTGQPVLAGLLAQYGHDQLVVIAGQIGQLEYGRDLVLAGAASLCLVWTGTPRRYKSRSTSVIKASTRLGMTP